MLAAPASVVSHAAQRAGTKVMREQKGGDHGEADGQGHRQKQELPQARHQGQGGQHQQRAQAGHQLRQGHFAGPVERRPRRGSAPSAKWRCVFSRQMIAASTSGPIARASPASVMTLIVLPGQLEADDRRRARRSGSSRRRSPSSATRPGTERSPANRGRPPGCPPAPGWRSTCRT